MRAWLVRRGARLQEKGGWYEIAFVPVAFGFDDGLPWGLHNAEFTGYGAPGA
jgi:hypothetical protein